MEATLWTYAAGVNRWALYAAALLATGSALFLLTMRSASSGRAAALGAGKRSSIAAGAAFVLAVGLGGADMMTGPFAILFDPETWGMGFDTTLGPSALAGVMAAGLLGLGFRTGNRAVLLLGSAAMVGSFVVTGHAAAIRPVWVMQTMVAVHMAVAAFWLGALLPLYQVARVDPPAQAGAVMADFSRLAVASVTLLVASGAVMSCIQLKAPAALFTTGYGWRLVAKLCLFGGLLALAAYNKLRLTPRLAAGGGQSAGALRRSIVLEYALFLLILGVAAVLSASEPPRQAPAQGAPPEASAPASAGGAGKRPQSGWA